MISSADAAQVDLHQMIRAILADARLASGYSLSGISFGPSIDISLSRAGSTFVVWLLPDSDTGRCYRRTAHFKIGYRGQPVDQLAYGLIDALCAKIEAWERPLDRATLQALFAGASDHARPPDWLPFLEWLALRSGIKPACRTAIHPDSLEGLIERARGENFYVETIQAEGFIRDFCTGHQGESAIVYVATREDAVHAAAEAERAMIATSASGRRPSDAEIRALGTALGYPECCIEAFLPVRDLSNGEMRFRALQRTTGPTPFCLNDTLEGRTVISHAVCRYDCAPSIAMAQALLRALADRDAKGARDLERSLRGMAMVFSDGDALRLVPADASDPNVYRFEAIETCGDRSCKAWHELLRPADGIRFEGGGLELFRDQQLLAHVPAPADEVQIRLFD